MSLIDARQRSILTQAVKAAEKIYEMAFPVINAFDDDHFAQKWTEAEAILFARLEKASQSAMGAQQLVRQFTLEIEKVCLRAKGRLGGLPPKRPARGSRPSS